MAATANPRALAVRALRAAGRRLPKPPDPPRAWRGVLDPGLEPLRIARYGDCSWREIEGWHGRGVRAGYPRVAAERLRERGLGVRFADVFAGGVHELPQDSGALVRHLHLDGEPDVVLLQVGGLHGLRMAMPPWPEWMRLRELAGRRTGALARPGYGVVHPLMRRFGDVIAPYEDDAPLERFVGAVRERWPGLPLVAVSPWPVCTDGLFSRDAVAYAWERIEAVYLRLGVPYVDPRPALADACARDGTPAVFSWSGYDMRAGGHRIAGDLLAGWIERELLDARGGAPAASATNGAGERLGGLEHR
jgi:hypothetical protein